MSNEIKEPEHEICIFKWGVVGKKNLLLHEMWIDNKDKVKILIGEKYLSVISINGKHTKIVNSIVYDRVKKALRSIYDNKIINYCK